MKLVYLFLAIAALLILIPVLRLPKTFSDNEEKRKLLRKKKREEERQQAPAGENH